MRFSTITMLNDADSVKVAASTVDSGAQVYLLDECYFIAYLIAAFS